MGKVHEIFKRGKSIVSIDQLVRAVVLKAARKSVRLMQTPEDAIRTNIFSPILNMCVRIAIDLDIFNIVDKHGPVTADKVAMEANAQEELIVRLLRVLCSISFMEEIGPRLYAPNALTRAMLIPSTIASVIHFFDQGLLSIACLPSYFRKFGYASPDDYRYGPFQFAHKTEMEAYTYWVTQPQVLNNFDTFMNGGKLGNRQKWTDWFPTDEIIINGLHRDSNAVLLVDIGGGRGHDIDSFCQKYGSEFGRLILQDLPETIMGISILNPRIERLVQNFFEPQTIIGARTYFIQDILHNWPTSVARLILRNIVAAMTPSHSILLVSELVLADTDCPTSMAGLDFGMMCLHSGLERSEKQWRELLQSEGLKVVQIHREPRGDGAIIEAVLPVKQPTLSERATK